MGCRRWDSSWLFLHSESSVGLPALCRTALWTCTRKSSWSLASYQTPGSGKYCSLFAVSELSIFTKWIVGRKGPISEGSQGEGWGRGHEGTLLACFLCFLTLLSCRITCSEMTLPTVGWTLISIIKQENTSNRLTHRPLEGDILSIVDTSSKMTQTCVKLTKTNQHSMETERKPYGGDHHLAPWLWALSRPSATASQLFQLSTIISCDVCDSHPNIQSSPAIHITPQCRALKAQL